ncbi:MAG: cytochrome d ubiquinol oxidase subunit II [Chloroflexi bacterium]|nr:cytochrome d ubiquinol oxidase subunit II [Chloroflexota bacterium]
MKLLRTLGERDDVFWAGIVLLALLVRGLGLASAPLGPREADLAYRAALLARGESVAAGPGGWLTGLLSGLFFLTGPQDFWARALPWLVGSLFPLLARAWEPWLGRSRARVLGLAWALDPALVAASRLAWGPILAIAGLGLAYTLAWQGRPRLAGLVGLTALGLGPGAALGWVFASALLLGWLRQGRPHAARRTPCSHACLGAVLAGVLLGITGWTRAPHALGAWLEGLLAYVRTYALVGAPVLLSLAVLGPIGVLLLAAERDRALPRALRVWLAAGLIAGAVWLVTPHRQGADLAWVSVALWPGVVAKLASFARPARAPWWLGPGLTALALGFVLFYAQWFAQLSFEGLTSRDRLLFSAVLLVSLLLWFFVFVYLASWLGSSVAFWGWRWFVLGVVIVWLGMGLRHARQTAWGTEWWQVPGSSPGVVALEQTMAQWGAWRFRRPDALPGAILADDPVLRWYHVSRFPEMRPRLGLMRDEAPPAVLAWQPVDLPQLYRGQAFTLSMYPRPSSVPSWSWLAYEQVDTQPLRVILFLREDLFWDARTDQAETR